MTYNVFGGTLSLAQSIKPVRWLVTLTVENVVDLQ